MGQTSPEIIKEVERGLENRMSSVMSQQFEKAGGVPTVAEILNVIDRATERSLLENLAQEDPDLVEEIRRLMFVFEDINKFSSKDIQTVLKNVENSQWAMALKGASEELKEKILGNMSKRAADMLREEMEYLGPVRLSTVEQVQQQIVDIVRRLEDAGEISMQANDEAEELNQSTRPGGSARSCGPRSARMPRTTSPATSVRRNRGRCSDRSASLVVDAEQVQDRRVQVVDADAIDRRLVADLVGLAVADVPPFTPPPASQVVNACGLWSRPVSPFCTIGSRPNSPPQITRVESEQARAA